MSSDVAEGRAVARAGVAGNPSDALGGAALAVPVPSLGAVVQLADAERLRVRPEVPEPGWASVDALVQHTARLGHDGGDRLVTASIVTLYQHLVAVDLAHDDAPFEAVWRTDIPRSVGLAGSSALVIATLRALAQRWEVDLPAPLLAELALRAEVEHLGIAAGWMDRAVQAHGAPTLVDRRTVPEAEVPSMQVVRPPRPVDLLVAWDAVAASPSGRLHGSLRDRHAAGDPEVVAAVDELVEVAHAASDALRSADLAALAESVDRSCGLRARLGALDDATHVMIRAARAAGGAATSAGSGGAVLVVPRSAGAAEVGRQLRAAGLTVVDVPVEPLADAGRGGS